MPGKSAAALQAEAYRMPTAPTPPPEPPAGMSPAQARIWREIAVDKPGDYFDGANLVLLELLVRHVDTSNTIAGQLALCDPRDYPQGFRRYSRLLIMASRETKAIAQLCGKLRLLPRNTPQPMLQPMDGGQPWTRHV
jgi:hypothetical protein